MRFVTHMNSAAHSQKCDPVSLAWLLSPNIWTDQIKPGMWEDTESGKYNGVTSSEGCYYCKLHFWFIGMFKQNQPRFKHKWTSVCWELGRQGAGKQRKKSFVLFLKLHKVTPDQSGIEANLSGMSKQALNYFVTF